MGQEEVPGGWPGEGLAQGAGAGKMALARWERRARREREGFRVKPGVISGIYTERARNPFSSSALLEEEGELK